MCATKSLKYLFQNIKRQKKKTIQCCNCPQLSYKIFILWIFDKSCKTFKCWELVALYFFFTNSILGVMYIVRSNNSNVWWGDRPRKAKWASINVSQEFGPVIFENWIKHFWGCESWKESSKNMCCGRRQLWNWFWLILDRCKIVFFSSPALK